MNAALNVTFAQFVDFAGAFTGTTLTLSKTNLVTFNSSLTLSGAITLVNDTAFGFYNSLTLNGTTSCTTIAHSSIGGVVVRAPLNATTSIVISNVGTPVFITYSTITTPTFTVTNGSVQLNGNLTCTGVITLTTGQLAVNGNYNVTAASFLTNGSIGRTIGLGNGTWTLTGTGTVWTITASTYLDAGNSTINITDSSSTAILFIGGSLSYNTLQWNRSGSTGNCSIGIGNNSFVNFVDLGTAAHTLFFQQGTTQTIGNFVAKGSPGNLITLNSVNGTNAFNLVKSPLGVVNCDYLNIQHCIATPSTNTWYAGPNSVNNQAISTAGSGWIFTNMPPRKLGAGGAG